MKRVLVDARNFDDLEAEITQRVGSSAFVGYDIETQDSAAHDGIKTFRGTKTARVFDVRRTVVTGFSIYPHDTDTAYYINLAHADVENRVPWEKARRLLDAKKPEAMWVAHNAPFEITNMRLSLDYELENVVCSMQACVSAYNPDEYDWGRFHAAGLGHMAKLMHSASKAFWYYDGKSDLTTEQGEIFSQIASKSSKASHSYNGHVYEISYGYGLKKAVESWFGHRMATFEETLGDKAHMGELTGEETAAYGADDAYWAVRLLLEVAIPRMASQDDQLVETFFRQENPMIYVFSDIWCKGLRVNHEAIGRRATKERAHAAKVLRELRGCLSHFLPFDDERNETLYEAEGGYQEKVSNKGKVRDTNWYSNYERYRNKIRKWIEAGDRSDDFEEMSQAAGAVTKGWWAAEGKKGDPTGPNFTHYMTMRAVLYDLLGLKPLRSKGKVQSDGDARGRLILRVKKWDKDERQAKTLRAIELINELANVEQAMKLYLTPYSQLTDPETGRMYPVTSSKLATRRIAGSVPNTMQLAKQGDTKYVRGFYLGDDDDQVVIALDWSQIELVTIGEFSGDPEFLRAYSTLPYNDLHRVAAAEILSAQYGVDLSPEDFASLRSMPDDVDAPFGFDLVDAQGNRLTPSDAYKYNRGTPGGKGANFGYWYSGALGSVASARGIGPDLMWKMTDAYRERFAVAEEWRKRTIFDAQMNGYVTLPDGHRRTRQECMTIWREQMMGFFNQYNDPGVQKFGELFCKRTRTRANNQSVNAMIQGTCATIIKRTILSTLEALSKTEIRARFLMPIHDELVWSVHRDDVMDFLALARRHMTNHPDLFQKTVLHCTASIGRTFEPYHPEKAPFGQIELDEAPAALGIGTPDGEMTEKEILETLEYLKEAL